MTSQKFTDDDLKAAIDLLDRMDGSVSAAITLLIAADSIQHVPAFSDVFEIKNRPFYREHENSRGTNAIN